MFENVPTLAADYAKNCLMEFPTGRWGFVGSVDSRLAYVQQDGSKPTAKQLDTAHRCGPGLAKLCKMTWLGEAEAGAAAAAIGVEIN